MVFKFKDVQSGLFLLFVSVIMFTATLSFKKLTTSQVGPAFMPQIIAFLIAVFSIVIIIQGFKKAKATADDNTPSDSIIEETSKEEVTYRPVILSFVLMAVYVVVMPIVGFLITTAAYMFIQMMILSTKPERKWPLFLVISVVSSSIIYYVFRNVFYIMLPNGFL